jgi:transcription antitermination factor NusG
VVSLGQQRAVRQVVVPTETVQEMKDNQKVTVEKRTMPGYVLVNMDLNEDSWAVVKGTPGVTGFVGASNEPIPLTQMEVDRLLHRSDVAVRAPSRAQFYRRVRQGHLRAAVRLLGRDLGDQRGREQAQGPGIHLRSRDPGGGRVRPGEEDLIRDWMSRSDSRAGRPAEVSR